MAIRCDVCGKPACVHITEIKNGAKTNTGLCENHARAVAGLPPGSMFPLEQITRSGGQYIEFFLWIREEFQMSGTIPSVGEMLASGKVPDASIALLEDEKTQHSFWLRLKSIAEDSSIEPG